MKPLYTGILTVLLAVAVCSQAPPGLISPTPTNGPTATPPATDARRRPPGLESPANFGARGTNREIALTNVLGGRVAAPPPGTATLPATTIPAVLTQPETIPAPTTASPTPGVVVPGTAAVSVPGAVAQTPATTEAPQATPLPDATLPVPGAPVNAAVAPGAGGSPAGDPAAASRAEQEQLIAAGTIQLQVMPLDQFLEVYATLSGRTVLRSQQIPAPPGLTLKLQTDMTRREALEGMDGVLALNGIVMLPIGEKFVKAVPAATAMQEGAPLNDQNPKDLPDSEAFITRIVKLRTGKPTEIAPLFANFSKSPGAITPVDSNSTIILRDYASNVKRMLDIIERVDVLPESDFKLEVIPIRYGKVEDIYATMESLISGSGTSPSGAAGAGSVSGARTTGGYRGGGGYRGAGGAGGYGGYNSGGIGGGYGGGYNQYNRGGGYYPQQANVQSGVAANTSSFQQRLNQIVNKAAGGKDVQVLENARIVPDYRSNKLLIFANKRDMEMITNIVSKVDVLLAQVLIEAIILEVKLNDSVNLGVSMLQNPRAFGNDFKGGGGYNNGPQFLNNITNFSSSLPSGFSYFGQLPHDLDFAVNAIARNSSVNIVSRPRIQTSHAVTGNFVIAETVPYVTGVVDYGGYVGSGLASRSQVTERQIGLDLTVTPFITPDGLVVMDISQNFDQRGADILIDGNPIPVVNTRSAVATLTLRDKDTIMLGGFITENKSKSKSGVPILKDIPGLGALFRGKNDSNDRTELIVLLRATVLETPEAAALMATSERSQLPGILEAEKSFEESEASRLKKSRAKTKR